MKKLIWGGWLLITVAIGSYFAYTVFAAEDKSDLLIGDASHGHFQIELACSSCHTEAFGGEELIQEACEGCHADELEAAHDSHPKKKFTDPRDAYRLEIIDARYCVSCHTEHQKEQTRAMGVTLPDDYCYHCHQEIGDERESHKDLPYDSCASAGCHNFHDNRALYETFLVENADQAWIKSIAQLEMPNAAYHSRKKEAKPLNKADIDAPAAKSENPEIVAHWEASSHADAGVNCSGCHIGNEQSEENWVVKPGLEQCQSCHTNEAKGFLAGKHGMRLAPGLEPQLSAIKPSNSPLEFSDASMNKEHGCVACHGAHEFNTQFAAAEACLGCHADEHSLAFSESPHGKLWHAELAGEIEAGQGLSCASCHMPRISKKKGGELITHVQHNQNDNLRPNEKMIRPVCMSCHGLEFAIDALADPELIKNNFSGKPSVHIESADWAKKRVDED